MKPFQDGDQWRQAFRAILDCRNTLIKDFALSRSYHERRLPEFLKEIIDKHGRERVRLVLAATISHASWDGRYSLPVKEWAAQVEPFPQFPGRQGEPRDFHEFCINAHPVIVNDTARLLMKQERELSRPARKEPER